MAVESGANFISQLNESYPGSGDLIKEGDDHIRLVKHVLKTTFPALDGKVDISSQSLNYLNANMAFSSDTVEVKSALKASVANKPWDLGTNRIKNLGAPTEENDAVPLSYLKSGGGADAAWPINSIFMTIDNRDPSVILGVGTWRKFSEGRVIVGSGTTKDARNESRSFSVNADPSVDTTGGTFQHVLSVAEMAKHGHGHNITATTGAGGKHNHDSGWGEHNARGNAPFGFSARRNAIGSNKTDFDNWGYLTSEAGEHNHPVTVAGGITESGNSQPFNIMQPFMVANIWVRTK